MTQTVDIGVRLTGETDDYVSNFERASAATDSITTSWDKLRTQGAAVSEGVTNIASAYTQATAVLDAFGAGTDDLVSKITESTLAQEAFSAATDVAEGLLGALGVQAEGYTAVLAGAAGLQEEFGNALADGAKGAADAGIQFTQMAQTMKFTGIASEYASGAVGKLKLAFLGLFAVFAVINIAIKLYEESEAIQLVVNRIVGMFRIGWSYIQEANDILVAFIETKFRFVVQALYPVFAQFAERVGALLSNIPGLEAVGEKLTAYAATLRKALTDTRGFEERTTEISASAAADRLRIAAETAQKSDDIRAAFAAKKTDAAVVENEKITAIAKAGADELEKLQRALNAAYVDQRRAALEGAFALDRDALQRQTAELQRALQARLVDERSYIEQLTQLRREAAQADLQRIASQQAEQTALRDSLVNAQRAADARGDRKAVLEIEKELVTVETRRDALMRAEIVGQRTLLDVTKLRAFEVERIERKEQDAYAAFVTFSEAQRKDIDDKIRGLELETSLRGKSSTEQRVANALAAIEIEYQRQMNALRTKAAELALAVAAGDEAGVIQVKLATDAMDALTVKTAALKELTAKGILDQGAFDQVKQFGDGLADAILSGFESGKTITQSFGDYLKQYFKKMVLQPTLSFLIQGGANGLAGLLQGVLGGEGGGLGALGSLFSNAGGGGGSLGGLSGILGSLVSPIISGLVGPGSAIGTALGLGSAVGAPTALAGAGVAGGAGTFAGGLSTILAAIPVWGWVALAAGAAAAILGADEKGIKIDNNLTNVGNPASHFTQSAIAAFDYSGDLGADVFATLTARVQAYDKILAESILSPDQLEKIRYNLNHAINPDWIGFDDDASAQRAIEAASKEFLQTRYGIVFDQIDVNIATAIRGFQGSSEELLNYIGKVLQLNDAFNAIIEEVPFLSLSLGDFVNASDEMRQTLATLGATLKLSSVDVEASAREIIDAAGRTALQALARQSLAVLDLSAAFDGSLAQAQALAQAEAQRLTMVQNLLVTIGQIGAQIGATLTASAEEFRLATLDASQKYQYFDQLANDTFAELQQSTDPERIAKLAEDYDRYLHAAFNLLTPEQQAEQGNNFADLADRANATAQAQLAASREAVLQQARDTGDLIRASIATAMQVVADDMKKASAEMLAAAELQAATARRGVVVTGYIDVSDGQRVPVDVQAGAQG